MSSSFKDFKGDTNSSVGDLICKLLKSVAYVHHNHLVTTVYSRHMALNEYYTSLPELVDAFAEASIARGYAQTFSVSHAEVEVEMLIDNFLQECTMVHEYLETKRHFDLVNLLEDIMSFMSSIRYKLNLKG
ncbi:hypothetical protein AsFcp4_322 [Aeromonas phage AsFcp_4]|uniref:Uncharacterized protein mobD.6 n=1 Tax=Aeromonas phage PX29 TaxID=926067 RepID=E5DQ98_9CAUD|nr:starvation-inducible transcriptional regulator [Aeromonas phage PX29]ADQ52884.1 MobD.6 conserved hypothetical protein [Aeromonas phage PX29]QAX98429.1 hypothetical protein ASfcp2_85 [Aeromonas phage AsFcp_2]QAX99772.1 hypothetical protein AsFcp4_322 [Aeromonas phage AsFcp_4]